jgi:AraC-like DNA-binding protein
MHTLFSAGPCPELSPYVRAYAERHIVGDAEYLQPVLSSLETVLEFDFGTPPVTHYRTGKTESAGPISVVGAHSHPRVSLLFSGNVRSFAVFFQPLGFWQLFGIPNAYLVDQAYPGVDILGAKTQRLWNALGDADSFARRVEIMERTLRDRSRTPIPAPATLDAASYAVRHAGMKRIEEIAARSNLSVRQLERRFSDEIGIGPKRFGKIARFQAALDAKIRAPRRTWLSIAHALGYHDQMHMVHDFRQFGSASPKSVFSMLGDGRPPALAAATQLERRSLEEFRSE